MSEHQRRNIDRVVDKIEAEVGEKGWVLAASDIDPRDIVAIRALYSTLGERLTVNKAVSPEVSIIAP